MSEWIKGNKNRSNMTVPAAGDSSFLGASLRRAGSGYKESMVKIFFYKNSAVRGRRRNEPYQFYRGRWYREYGPCQKEGFCRWESYLRITMLLLYTWFLSLSPRWWATRVLIERMCGHDYLQAWYHRSSHQEWWKEFLDQGTPPPVLEWPDPCYQTCCRPPSDPTRRTDSKFLQTPYPHEMSP